MPCCACFGHGRVGKIEETSQHLEGGFIGYRFVKFLSSGRMARLWRLMSLVVSRWSMARRSGDEEDVSRRRSRRTVEKDIIVAVLGLIEPY